MVNNTVVLNGKNKNNISREYKVSTLNLGLKELEILEKLQNKKNASASEIIRGYVLDVVAGKISLNNKKNEKKSVSYRVCEKDLRFVEEFAKKYNTNISDVISYCIRKESINI